MKWFKRRGVERAAPEVSRRFLEQTKARDVLVNAAVGKNSKRVEANHLGPLMDEAFSLRRAQ